jgi:hypothetical protein
LVNELERKRLRRRNGRKPRSRLFVVFETSICCTERRKKKREARYVNNVLADREREG